MLARYGTTMERPFVLLALFALAACGAGENDPGPGGVTVGEARALDEAAEMIEARRLPGDALAAPTSSPGNADGAQESAP